MQGRIIVTADGQVAVMADDGTYLQGSQAVQAVLKYLEAAGVPLTEVTPVEQHRAEDDLLHELSHLTEPGHNH